jgi:threonine dehydratase
MIGKQEVMLAASVLRDVLPPTPLQYNERLSAQMGCELYLKREDLQSVRSYKIRGAYFAMSQRQAKGFSNEVVCASAGNHAQGVAYACAKQCVKGTVFMPRTTPQQKVAAVRYFGQEWITVVLEGDTFDDAYAAARNFSDQHGFAFIHPFDDDEVIAGQGTVALEMSEQWKEVPDVILVPIGGGGLAAGTIAALKEKYPEVQIIGVEPAGAASMQFSLQRNQVETLLSIDPFVDGAAVKRVGDRTFEICKTGLSEVLAVSEGKVCEMMLRLYNEHALVVEPAGALTMAALDSFSSKFAGKKVIAVISGSNNDSYRMSEIQERALLFQGKKHYLLIEFPQRPGALKQFVSEILGPDDDITYFQFAKKNHREKGPAVVGIEVKNPTGMQEIFKRLSEAGMEATYVNNDPLLFQHLVG